MQKLGIFDKVTASRSGIQASKDISAIRVSDSTKSAIQARWNLKLIDGLGLFCLMYLFLFIYHFPIFVKVYGVMLLAGYHPVNDNLSLSCLFEDLLYFLLFKVFFLLLIVTLEVKI